MPQDIIAGVVQMCSRQDISQNLRTCKSLVEEAARRGASLVVVPENFAYIGVLREKVRLAEPLTTVQPGPILSAMVDLARSCRIHLLLGGVPIRSQDPSRFHNTSILLDFDGRIVASYRKIHLFDINIPGGAVFKESDCVLAGDEIVTTPVDGAVLGLSICYDLRFPELYRELGRRGATILCVPAAFTLHTGKDHWLPLLRARAIENLCYVLAANQQGAHTEQRSSFGKSCIVDPWGAIIAQVPDVEGVAVAHLDLAHLARLRQELPSLSHRRLP